MPMLLPPRGRLHCTKKRWFGRHEEGQNTVFFVQYCGGGGSSSGGGGGGAGVRAGGVALIQFFAPGECVDVGAGDTSLAHKQLLLNAPRAPAKSCARLP